MQAIKIIASVVLALLIVLVLVAPVGPMPGLFIGGTSAEAPARWPDTSQVDEIKLGVPGTLPRVVIIWVIEHGGELHVVGSNESGWVKMIGDESPVDMRLGDTTYALNASLVTKDWQPIVEAYVAKYEADYPDIIAGFPSMDEAEGQVSVFRLNRN